MAPEITSKDELKQRKAIVDREGIIRRWTLFLTAVLIVIVIVLEIQVQSRNRTIAITRRSVKSLELSAKQTQDAANETRSVLEKAINAPQPAAITKALRDITEILRLERAEHR